MYKKLKITSKKQKKQQKTFESPLEIGQLEAHKIHRHRYPKHLAYNYNYLKGSATTAANSALSFS